MGAYHPPTRGYCEVCESLGAGDSEGAVPLMDSLGARASSAANFPVHNWYHFVLGYTPEFPAMMLERHGAGPETFVVDPFMGTGTTLVECKRRGVPSAGIDANDYFADVVEAKTSWGVDPGEFRGFRDAILDRLYREFDRFTSRAAGHQQTLFSSAERVFEEYAAENRPPMLTRRYMSDVPFARLHLVDREVRAVAAPGPRRLLDLAVSSIVVPASNVRYGPGFGVGRAKPDVDVLGLFKDKTDRMIRDLQCLGSGAAGAGAAGPPARAVHGDSRELTRHFGAGSADLMITSPPYPGDHEYTKHTRLELIFTGYATDPGEFREIKQRMVRGSTTNIYKADRETEFVGHIESIRLVTDLIDERLASDGATSGFEGLYTRLVWEYFGGMHRMLAESREVLKPGGSLVMLVSDSHAFKMVHIRTAELLAEIGLDVGYAGAGIEPWQDKKSTSHAYRLRENILTLTR